MTYQEFIDDILQTRGRFINDNEYHERHHIIPKCKNGSDNEDNLIDLFAKEHFIAHKLLAEENADDDQLAHAYVLMAFVKDKNQKRYELTPDEYEEARKIYVKRFSGGNNPSAKRVIRLCDNKVYDTVKECCIDNGINNTQICSMLNKYREFVRYSEWINMSECEQQRIKSIDWKAVEHRNRSEAAKRAGNGGSVKCSPSTRAKIGAANKGRYGKRIYSPELNEVFESIQAASDKYSICKTSITYCLCGKQKHAGKHPVTGEQLTWVQLENKNC